MSTLSYQYAPEPRLIRVVAREGVPPGDDSPLVNLNHCELWIRDYWDRRTFGPDDEMECLGFEAPRQTSALAVYSGDGDSHTVLTRSLYRTSRGKWIMLVEYFDEPTPKPDWEDARAWYFRWKKAHARWAQKREVAAWFLLYPDVDPPDDMRAELDGFDATDSPPAESKPIQAPAPVSIEAPAAPPLIDFTKIATELRRGRKEYPARLVEFFADKSEATFHALKTHVHEGHGGESAIKSNVKRTNAHLEDMECGLRFSIRSQPKIIIRVLPTE